MSLHTLAVDDSEAAGDGVALARAARFSQSVCALQIIQAGRQHVLDIV